MRGPRLEQPPLDPQFTGLFSAPNDTIDLSSLHWAITDLNPDTGRAEECNIHIDQVGITASLGSGVSVTPDLVYHTLVELAFRTGLKGYLPDYMLQRINFILPSSHENFAANFGVEYTPIKRDDLRSHFVPCAVTTTSTVGDAPPQSICGADTTGSAASAGGADSRQGREIGVRGKSLSDH